MLITRRDTNRYSFSLSQTSYHLTSLLRGEVLLTSINDVENDRSLATVPIRTRAVHNPTHPIEIATTLGIVHFRPRAGCSLTEHTDSIPQVPAYDCLCMLSVATRARERHDHTHCGPPTFSDRSRSWFRNAMQSPVTSTRTALIAGLKGRLPKPRRAVPRICRTWFVSALGQRRTLD